MLKLDAKAFGLACGIIWAAGLVIMGIIAITCPWAKPFVNVVSVMYRGYSASIVGSLIGGVWGFVDAGIGGLVIAWLYNKLAK